MEAHFIPSISDAKNDTSNEPILLSVPQLCIDFTIFFVIRISFVIRPLRSLATLESHYPARSPRYSGSLARGDAHGC